jgi:uncharacterized membrane protein YhaH (DUF805 family)
VCCIDREGRHVDLAPLVTIVIMAILLAAIVCWLVVGMAVRRVHNRRRAANVGHERGGERWTSP